MLDFLIFVKFASIISGNRRKNLVVIMYTKRRGKVILE